MPICKMLWGASSSGASPHYENELLLGYPAYDWITDRVPREGSEFAQAPSGVEDAWITGRDYVFEGEFRFIPDKPSTSPERSVVAGPNSWQAFLDYCRDKNDFRFVPNVNTPDFYVEKCYLVEPLRGFGGNLADLTRGVRLVMRTTSMDFTQAMRGVAFEYKPGIQVNQLSSGASFGRAGTGTFIQAATTAARGQVVGSAGSGVMRDRYRTSSGAAGTLLEAASTNLALHSEALDNAVWTKGGISVTANNRKAPDASGSTTADRLVASTSSGTHEIIAGSQVVSTGATISFLGHLRATELDQAELFVVDVSAGGVNFFGALVNLSCSTASSLVGGGGSLSIGPTVRALDDSWFEVSGAGTFGTTSTGSTGARLALRLRSSTGAQTFAGATSGQGMDAWGLWYAQQNAPGSYLPSSSAVGTRPADVIGVDWPWKPQAAWAYAKFEERGSVRYPTDTRVLEIGTSAAAAPRFMMYQSSTLYRAQFFGASTYVEVAVSVTPAQHNIVELLATLSTSGSVSLSQSLNGAAEVASTASAALAIPSTWSGASLWLNSVGANAVGSMALMHCKVGFSTSVTSIALARSA